MKTYAKDNKKFYDSKAWRECRNSFIAERISIDGGVCQRCKQSPGFIVHHIEHLNGENTSRAEIALDHSNLEYLCHRCHDDEHLPTRQHKEPCMTFDANGQPIPTDSR